MIIKKFIAALFLMLFVSTLTIAQWSTSPTVNNQVSFMSGDQTQCYVATHPNGNTFISWFSSETGGMYYPRVQLFDVEGYQQWTDEGILVSSHPSMTWITDYDMTVSSDGGCVIAFQDTRNGSNDPFIYKISPTGEFLWGDDGIQLFNDSHFDADPKLLATEDGGAYVAWPKSIDNGDNKVIVQRITADGQKAWANDLELWETGFDYAWPQLVTDNEGGFILTWYKEWGPYWAPNREILAQRFDEDGNAIWQSNSLLFTGVIPIYIHQQAVADGDGGVYVCWYYEQTAGHLSTFVQHVDTDGNVAFPLGGLEATTNMTTLSLEPAICTNETTHDLYITWRETNLNQTQFGLYGQRIDLAGNRLWGANGQQFVPVGSQNPILINLSPVGPGGVITYLLDAAIGMNSAVQAIRFDDTGNQVWTGSPIDVSSVSSDKGKLHAGEFHNGQVIVTWADGRTGNSDIFAQNVSEEGNLGPLAYEFTVTPDTLFFLTPEAFADGVPFTITNTGSNPLNILYIQPDGIPAGPYLMWYIEPDIPSYPITLNPGEYITETVRWIVMDAFPGTIVYDTLEIHILSDTTNLIIAADSSYIIMANETPTMTDINIFPNPFHQQTQLSFDMSMPSHFQIIIYNSQMKTVRTLLDRKIAAGSIQLIWDGLNDAGMMQSPGIYFIMIRTEETMLTRKLIKVQ